MRILALTGTPGTGKTTVAARLAERHVVVTDRELADRCGALEGEDLQRGALVVDEHLLWTHAREELPQHAPTVVVEGLLAHHADPDLVVVLRCHPGVLRERLAGREWPPKKVEENVMAETLDAVALDVDARGAWELDTTELGPEEAADIIARLFNGEDVAHPALRPLGTTDWSATLLEDDGR